MSFLENRRLRDDYAYLQGRIDKVYRELRDTKDELKDLRKDFYKLNTYNQGLGRENDELRAAIEHYRLQDDDADAESDGDSDHRPERKKRRKVKAQDDDDGSNDENARVRYNLHFKQSLFFLLSFL